MVLGPLVLSVAAPAQKAVIDRQVDFIRALARDLGFVALAQEETDRLLKDKKAADEFRQVAQLGIEISLYGAKALRNDRERQRTLFKDALDRSKEFLERYRGDAVALPAQITLTEACYEFGRFLADEVEIARSDTPDKVKELEDQAAAVFQLGKDTCDEVMTALASAAKSDADAHLKRGVAWLRKGILLREHARAVKKDREYLASTARSTLADLAITYGEETILGMRAMFEGSQVDEVEGKIDLAADNYRGTIEAIFDSLTEQEELPPAARGLLGSMMQEAYDRLTTTQLAAGRTDDVMATVKEFDERLKKLEAEEDDRFGHSVRLNYARALAESGDKDKVSQGLKIAATINDQHPSDVVGLKAKNILRDILATQSSLVSGDLLYQIALGDLQSRRFEASVQGFKRAIAAMTPAEAGKLGLLAYLNMARGFGAQTRPLEAVYALRAGLTQHKDSDATAASDAGRLLEVAMRQVRALSKNDSAFDALNNEVVQLAASVGGARSQDKVNWQLASDKMSQNQFVDAAGAFAMVTPESPYYELALVRQVQAWKAAKQPDKALAAADAYRSWRDGAGKNAPTTNRDLAEAELEFNLGDLAYMQATGDGSGKGDAPKFQEVVSRFADYPKRYGNIAPTLSQFAYDLLARSYVELGERDKAEAAYRNLAKLAPDSSMVPKLATAIFVAHYENVKHLSDELDGAYKNGDQANIKPIKERLTAARKATVAFGRDYARASLKPQYGVLYISLQNADELKDWTAAQELAAKIIEVYGTDPDEKSKIDQYVRPILGKILLRQQKVREAHTMLVAAETELDSGGTLRAAAFPVKQLICQALGGWREIDERGDVVSFPGLGRPAEAYDKQWTEVKKFALSSQRGVTDFSLPWYEFHWEAYLYASLAGAKDSKYKGYAESLYRIASSTDNFDTLRKLGPRGEELAQLFITLQRGR